MVLRSDLHDILYKKGHSQQLFTITSPVPEQSSEQDSIIYAAAYDFDTRTQFHIALTTTLTKPLTPTHTSNPVITSNYPLIIPVSLPPLPNSISLISARSFRHPNFKNPLTLLRPII